MVKKDFSKEQTEKKRKTLTYLYLYWYNANEIYEGEKTEFVKTYYDKFRYKGSYYNDAKQFEKYGNPKNWDDKKINRFQIKEHVTENKFSIGLVYFDKSYPSYHCR